MTQPGPRFSRRVEDFTCGHCGRVVRGTGYTNHCPGCLWSRHVDISPGDRLADCDGDMEPVGTLYERGEYIIVQKCTRCGHLWRNRAAPDDSRSAIGALAGRPVGWPAGDSAGRRRRPRPVGVEQDGEDVDGGPATMG